MRKKVLQVLFNISCYSRLHPFPGWYFLLSKMQRETLELFSGIYLQGEPLPGAVGGLEWVAGAAVGMGLLRGDRRGCWSRDLPLPCPGRDGSQLHRHLPSSLHARQIFRNWSCLLWSSYRSWFATAEK